MKATLRSDIAAFKREVLSYYRKNKRDLPWRNTTDPYKILVSEVMLQQTQADRVIPKYKSFIEKFPTVSKLANAKLSEVLKEWQGLGYNSRGKRLHDAAKIVVDNFGANVPSSRCDLESLPGIGPYTAGAILAFVYNKKEVCIETNIRAVYTHFFFRGKENVSDKEIIALIEKTIPNNPREWFNALMDYGAMLKAKGLVKNSQSKHYAKQSKFEGSNRQVRGAIIRALSITPRLTIARLEKEISDGRVRDIADTLLEEGLIRKNGKSLELA